MITVYVKRFNREVDEEPHVESYEIEELRKLLMIYIEKNDSRVNEIIKVLNNLIEKPRETKPIGF